MSIELTVPGGGHLILRKGTNGSGPILGESDSRKLSGTLAAGTYTVEVAMNAPNGNGHSFNLEIKQGADIPTPPMACVHTASLGVVVDGDWSTASAAGCGSFERSGSPSRWYKFTLTSAATVDISVDVVPGSMTGGFGLYSIRGSYLYLRAGDNAYSGLHIAENNYIAREHKSLPGNQDISGWDSFITTTLQPGTYTIEVTTAGQGSTGQYKLHVRTR